MEIFKIQIHPLKYRIIKKKEKKRRRRRRNLWKNAGIATQIPWTKIW